MSAQANNPQNLSDGAQQTGWELFLSYNSADRASVQDVERLLRERNISTFLDRDNLTRGQPWMSALQEAIGRASAVAVFIGRDGLGSWQKREMEIALDRQAQEEKAGKRFAVIPILLPGSEIEKAPAFLLLNTWVDLRARLDDGEALDDIVRAVRGETARAPEASAQPALCPYKALRAFREEDAPLFFGRKAFAGELLKKTLDNSLVAVVGSSGSGKSSVVQAGLLPLLRRQHPPAETWEAVIFTPGKRPFHNLSAVLVPVWEREASETKLLEESSRLGKNLAEQEVLLEDAVNKALDKLKETGEADRLLLIVDQFEELFTLTPEADRRRFVDSLLQAAAATKLTVLLTLRADFYGQAISLSRELSDLIQQGLVNLGPMTKEELQQAIVCPAQAVHLEFEKGLVSRILEKVVDQPGSLPLLEFALTELWNNRRGNLLTNAAYDETGEVDGAIAQRAETQFNSLSKEQQEVMLRFLSRLVRVASAGEEGSDTRQRVNLRDFNEETRTVVHSFVKARLLVMSRNEATNEETVEVAHEALIRRWPLLQNLIDKDRDFLLWRQRLGILHGEWRRTNQDEGALLRGAQLLEAKSWLKEREPDLTEPEKEFIRASSKLEARSNRTRIWATAAVALILLIGFSGYLGWRAWDRSPRRQIARIMENAPRVVNSMKGFETCNNWMRALIRTGNTDKAIELSNGITDPEKKARAFTAIATELVKTGDVNAAKKAAEQALASCALINGNFNEKESAFISIAHEFEKAKLRDEATKAAYNSWTDSKSEYADTVAILIRNGKSEEALERARKEKFTQPDMLLEAAVEFFKIGEPIKASQAVDEVLEAARQVKTVGIHNLYFQLGTFNQSAAALAQLGKIDEALKLARQTSLQVKEAAKRKKGETVLGNLELRADTSVAFTAIAVALAKEGNLKQAKELVQQEVEKDKQTEVWTDIAKALAKANKTEEAKSAAHEGLLSLTSSAAEGESEEERLADEAQTFRGHLLPILCKLGMIEEALNENSRLRAAQVKSPPTGSVFTDIDIEGNLQYIAVVVALAKNGNAERALSIASEPVKLEERIQALNLIGLVLLKNGKKDVAGRAATGALEILDKIQNKSSRINYLADLVPILIGLGRSKEATELAIKTYKEADLLQESEEKNSSAYNAAAKALAKVENYYDALNAANKCTAAKDKLDAYTWIFVEYHKRLNPEFAKALEREEQEEDEDGSLNSLETGD